jgi:predicted dehydrogenase
LFNLAIVSTAHIHTKSYLENIAKGTDGRVLHAIWDDVPERGQRFAAEFKAPFVADLAALVRDPEVSAFIICAENTRHLPLLKRVIPAGKPVFCEKPLTTTTKDIRAVAALLRRHPAKLMSGYFQPFGGVMQAVAKMLQEEAFGQVTRVRFRNAHHAAYGRWFDSPDLAWFHNPALSGGGAFMDMGTHAIHLLRTLFGPAAAVWSLVANHAGIYPAVDDFGVAHLRFASGVFGTVEAAWTQTGGLGGLEIVGSKATLWHNGKEYVSAAPKQEPVPVVPLPDRPRGVDRLVGILKREVTDAEVDADLAATVDAVAIMDAAYRSGRTGRWTPIPAVGTRT